MGQQKLEDSKRFSDPKQENELLITAKENLTVKNQELTTLVGDLVAEADNLHGVIEDLANLHGCIFTCYPRIPHQLVSNIGSLTTNPKDTGNTEDLAKYNFSEYNGEREANNKQLIVQNADLKERNERLDNLSENLAKEIACLHEIKEDLENRYGCFTCFPALPPEVRGMIWQLSIDPRVVTLKFKGRRLPQQSQEVWDAYAGERVPVIGNVCQDSRAALTRSYMIIGEGLRRAYFRPCIDTLLLRQDGLQPDPGTYQNFPEYWMFRASLKDQLFIKKWGVKYMAFEGSGIWYWKSFLNQCKNAPGFENFLDRLSSLEEVVILRRSWYSSEDPSLYYSSPSSNIRHPHVSEAELRWWDDEMKLVGNLVNSTNSRKLKSVRVSVAMFNDSENRLQYDTKDSRNGLRMIGPANRLV